MQRGAIAQAARLAGQAVEIVIVPLNGRAIDLGDSGAIAVGVQLVSVGRNWVLRADVPHQVRQPIEIVKGIIDLDAVVQVHFLAQSKAVVGDIIHNRAAVVAHRQQLVVGVVGVVDRIRRGGHHPTSAFHEPFEPILYGLYSSLPKIYHASYSICH